MEIVRMPGKEGATLQKQPNMLSTWSIPSLLSFFKVPVLDDGCISLICFFKVSRGAFSSGARMGGFLHDYIHVIRATFVGCLAQSDDGGAERLVGGEGGTDLILSPISACSGIQPAIALPTILGSIEPASS